MPNGIAGVAQCDLSHKLSPSIAYKKGAFLIKNTVYSHPASAILYSPPERNVIHIDIYQSKRKNNVDTFASKEIPETQHTKAPPKYIDGALPYELCLSLRKFDQFSTYLTIVLTASSPSTATATIPAGTAIVALSEVRTVSATTLPKMLVITTDLPAAP